MPARYGLSAFDVLADLTILGERDKSRGSGPAGASTAEIVSETSEVRTWKLMRSTTIVSAFRLTIRSRPCVSRRTRSEGLAERHRVTRPASACRIAPGGRSVPLLTAAEISSSISAGGSVGAAGRHESGATAVEYPVMLAGVAAARLSC